MIDKTRLAKHLLEDLQTLRRLFEEVRPEGCCGKATMRENGKGESIVCANDCEWQKIDLALATAMVDAEIIGKDT